MTAMSDDNDAPWNRYGVYLRFLAESQLDRRIQSRLDLSGIIQQSLLEAHQAHIDGQAQITLPWLRQILAHNLTDGMRRLYANKRDIRREQSFNELIERSSIRLEAMLRDGAPLPPDLAERQEQVLRLSEAMQKLPGSQREALILQVWQGKTLAEIAEQMGRTTQAVAGLLKRGLSQLRQSMCASDGFG